MKRFGFALLIGISLIIALSGSAFSGEVQKYFQFDDIREPCAGQCAVSVFSGVYSKSGMGNILLKRNGIFTSRWGGGGIFGGFASRRLLRIGKHFQIEGEIGLAQRFGNHRSAEIWSAFAFRITNFPWDKYVITTLAATTGLNYAFKDDPLELARFDNGGRSAKLQHFLSPELTFALPKYPNNILFFRFHHRSGGSHIFNRKIGLFNGAGGAADYGTVGFRVKF